MLDFAASPDSAPPFAAQIGDLQRRLEAEAARRLEAEARAESAEAERASLQDRLRVSEAGHMATRDHLKRVLGQRAELRRAAFGRRSEKSRRVGGTSDAGGDKRPRGRRPRPHAASGPRGEDGDAEAGPGPVPVQELRQAVRRQWRPCIGDHRDRGQGACPPDPASALPARLRLFRLAGPGGGGAYRAVGWIHVGATKGRGRNDTRKEQAEPKKDIWLRPLRKDWRRVLNRVEQK